MQTRKPDIEQAILLCAEEEFYVYGYEGASVRRIIKAADTSIGNFYNYYDSKESLFNALVKDEYRKFVAFINNHESVSKEFSDFDIQDSDIWRRDPGKVLKELVPGVVNALIPDFGRRFVILIESSGGTTYANARIQLIEIIREHFLEHTRDEGINLAIEFTNLLAEQFIDGFIRIIKENQEDIVKRNSLLADFIVFFFAGAMGLLGSR